jgi:uncharacterized protein YaaQ
MKLILAIVNNDDSAVVSATLTKENYSVTKLSTTGGFLMIGNTTLLIGAEDDKVARAKEIIREYSMTRNKVAMTTSSLGRGLQKNALEEEVTVLLVVLVESHAFAQLVASVIVAAGVVAGVRVDARLHAQQVDVLHHGQQSVGESGRVDEQFARILVAPSEVAVVDVDVVVSHFQKTLRLHGSGLILND